jgi:hypothetical protein
MTLRAYRAKPITNHERNELGRQEHQNAEGFYYRKTKATTLKELYINLPNLSNCSCAVWRAYYTVSADRGRALLMQDAPLSSQRRFARSLSSFKDWSC